MSLVRSCTKLLKLCNTFLQKFLLSRKKFFRAATSFDASISMHSARTIASIRALRATFNRVKSSCRRTSDRSVALRGAECRIASARTAPNWPNRRSSTATIARRRAVRPAARQRGEQRRPRRAPHAPLEMNRIEAVPRRRHWNYRYFSRFARVAMSRSLISRTSACASANVSVLRGKSSRRKNRNRAFAKSFDAADRQLRDDRRRAGLRESIEASFDPIRAV